MKSKRSKFLSIVLTLAMMLTFIAVPLESSLYAAGGNVTPVSAKKKAGNYSATIRQITVGDTRVSVSIPKAKKLKRISKVKVSFKMTYKGKTVKSKSKTRKMKDIKANSNSFTVKLPAFGKYKLP